MTEFVSQYFNLTWIYWFFTLIYALTIISIVGVVISQNRNPVKTLAWVTVLLALPAFGLILYIVFGRNIKNKRIVSRSVRRRLRRREIGYKGDLRRLDLTDSSVQHIRLAQSLAGAPYFIDNSAELFNNGSDKIDAMLVDISGATRYINLQYYILSDDEVGCRLRDALIKRARAGVKVRVIYDHVGSFRVRKRFFRSMSDAGIEIYPFYKVSFPLLGSRINWRNHRKLCIIDGETGYIGGMNIADRYLTGGKFDVWRDLHLRIKGSAVMALEYSFAVDWYAMGHKLDEETSEPATKHHKAGSYGMQLLTSGPNDQWSNIAFVFLQAISQAKKCIYIQTPYFLPTDALLRALQASALAKVDVRIMIPRRSDSEILRYASYSYINECLQAGIKFYLYEPGMLHSKSMLVDDEFATVGSTNFDFRSVEHNFESNMFIYSREFNEKLREQFYADQAECYRVKGAEWRRRPKRQKAKESLMRIFAPIL
ncbi:MAG: cardiolipin synthase [Muribaculaceae bacterium]|nr:cardiolipin synthase [Muribaculaceae bacterium]